ncbi:pyridoxamine 5'-phosphate oxidase family protein [Streptomyces apocyni]|uniref:pyridoxamine 5'-phosphate oxidase family protein n=1 Tax=Streptomyces apocyni TaxID=2654677 RepID=UPI0012EA1D5B|nr:pyridoxamine 5'-phosphate oxidase family protein [Streptomyces apocyni]
MAVYHSGELSVQRRAGVSEQAAHTSAAIRAEMPRVAADFLARQPMLVIGATDARGDIWASLLTGAPGFLTATGPDSLSIDAAPSPGDPLYETLTSPVSPISPARLGMIAIDPAARRRMRMNGIARRRPHGWDVDLDQVYANCPKYIQKREYAIEPTESIEPTQPAAPQHSAELTADQQRFITQTDTFFVATADRDGNADASHRGGNPGFVELLSPTRLRWPDYVGNAMFNTLGNIEVNPRAGLLLPDWTTGTTLQLTGTAAIDWDADHAAAVPGAERFVEFAVDHVVEIPHASPLRWAAPEYSRFNPPVNA